MIAGWNPATADIDLQLLDPLGTVLAISEGITDEELVDACIQEPGTYYLRVYGILGDTGPYELVVLAEPSNCCLNDIHEPNDTWPAATTIPSALTRMEGKVCPSDADWFKINAPAGQRLSATLTITGGGDLDLELYDRDGTRRLDYSFGTASTEQVDYDIATAGYYYLRVFGYRSETGTYQLTASFGASSGCTSARTCAAGTICRAGACADDACTPPGTGGCPTGYFCPAPGGTGGQSDCVDTCTTSSTCR
jgi:hypothetical protein